MSALGVGFVVAGIVLVAVNAATTGALWSSPAFERPQKIAQTVLIWLVPGFFYVVRYMVREPTGGSADDPTVSRDGGYAADSSFISHGHGDGGHGF